MWHNSFFNKKTLSRLLLIFFTSLLPILTPQKATAYVVPVIDGSNLVQNSITAKTSLIIAKMTAINTTANVTNIKKEFLGDSIGYVFAKQILRRITAQTVNWINSGFEGNPAFVTDPQRFFLGMADQTASQFFLGANSPLNQLCSPFRAEVRLALVKNYLADQDPNQYQCTFEKIGANFETFTRDFTQGGWGAWLTMTQNSQNNPYGAYLEGQKALSVKIQTQKGIKEKQIADGRGFLSYERCRRDYVPPKTTPKCVKFAPLVAGEEAKCLVLEQTDENGEVQQCPDEEKEVVTPGSVINEKLGQALGSSFAQLEAADEINEIVNALMIQLIEKTFSSVQGGLRGLSQSKNNQPSTLQQLSNSVSQTTLEEEIGDATNIIPSTLKSIVTGGEPDPIVRLPTEEEVRLQVEQERAQLCLNDPSSCEPASIIITPSTPPPPEEPTP